MRPIISFIKRIAERRRRNRGLRRFRGLQFLGVFGVFGVLGIFPPAPLNTTPHAIAQSSSVSSHPGGRDECLDRINREMAGEQRTYRAAVFGKREAENSPLFDIRYSQEGNAWMKVGKNQWRSGAKGFESTTWSNTLMDEQDEHTESLPIPGVFTETGVLTSELIPYLLIDMRALQCNIETICETTRLSRREDATDPVAIQVIRVPGCLPVTTAKTYPECHLAIVKESGGTASDTESYCRDIGHRLLEREAELLKLAVEYDAAYRTMLQIAGNLDMFLGQYRFTLTGSIRDAVSLIGQLNRIPCFLAACDESPPPMRRTTPP